MDPNNEGSLQSGIDKFFDEIYEKVTPSSLKRTLDQYSGNNLSNTIILNSFYKLNKLITTEEEKKKS